MNFMPDGYLASKYQEKAKLLWLGEKVLLIAASHTGNNVFCTPSIRLLKKQYPDSTFDLVVLNKHTADVFYGNPDINKLYIANKQRTLNKLSKGYSTVICMDPRSHKIISNIKSNLISAPPFVDGTHRAELLLQFIAVTIGCDISDQDRAYVIGSGLASGFSLLDSIDIDTNDILVCMHLGCGKTSIHGWKFFYKHRATHPRLWSIENYILLGKHLIDLNSRIRIVITGTKNEVFLGKEFEKSIPGTINLIAKTSASQLFKVMASMDLFISQDSGALHIASASNVALLGLFGPSNPVNTGPYPTKINQMVIKKECMAEISPSEVAKAAITLLENFRVLKINARNLQC